MNQADSKLKPFIIPGLIILAALVRIMPHPWNATPVAAMALFGGYALRNRFQSVALPLAALLLSDVVLQATNHTGFYGVEQIYVYSSFVLTNLLGRFLKPKNIAMLGALSLTGSLLFFIVTNFGTWLTYPQTYAHTPSGLALCYAAGIPFFTNTLIGDLFFNGVFFAAFALIPGLKYTTQQATRA